jgi:hypothetical protein
MKESRVLFSTARSGSSPLGASNRPSDFASVSTLSALLSIIYSETTPILIAWSSLSPRHFVGLGISSSTPALTPSAVEYVPIQPDITTPENPHSFLRTSLTRRESSATYLPFTLLYLQDNVRIEPKEVLRSILRCHKA